MPKKSSEGAQTVSGLVMSEIRRAILEGTIAPGEHLRQEAIAERLEVSRFPVREALQRLVSEGTVVYDRNRGYFVAQMGAEDMRQVYLMRELLETELVTSMRPMAEADVDRLAALNDDIRKAAEAGDFYAFAEANRGFHFLLYAQSPLHLVLAEVERLWNLSEQYRALYLYRGEAQQQIIEEHERVIDAVRANDRARCARILSEHRRAAEEEVCGRLTLRDRRASRSPLRAGRAHPG
ncbi:MAG TPA: GntR family transcriptional regulator [Streptosporangiaceae bacterium]|nr:GntR family transcriptional regulator [Streptosporangiaceae bacterium]